jgi:nitrate reductase NapE
VEGRERVADSNETTFTKAQELRSFLFLAVVMAPVLAVVFVSGYGFIVWMYQLIAGPPGS